MPATSPILGLPIAIGADPAKQYPAAVDNPRTLSLETYTVPRFASAAARDAAIPTPADGQLAYTQDAECVWLYRTAATAWCVAAGRTPRAGFTAAQASYPVGSTKIIAPVYSPGFGWGQTGGALIVPVSGIYEFNWRVQLYPAVANVMIGYGTSAAKAADLHTEVMRSGDSTRMCSGAMLLNLDAGTEFAPWVTVAGAAISVTFNSLSNITYIRTK